MRTGSPSSPVGSPEPGMALPRAEPKEAGGIIPGWAGGEHGVLRECGSEVQGSPPKAPPTRTAEGWMVGTLPDVAPAYRQP